jgi:hypothetical protein
MNDERLVLVWLGLAVIAFVGCYKSTKNILPRSRWEGRAVLKAAVRAFPWAFLFAPSVAFGAIPMPMPAGLLIVGWIWSGVVQAPNVQGPHNATGPMACMAFVLSWFVILVGTFLGLRLADEKK